MLDDWISRLNQHFPQQDVPTRHPAPVEVGSFFHFLRRFYTSLVVFSPDFWLPSTVFPVPWVWPNYDISPTFWVFPGRVRYLQFAQMNDTVDGRNPAPVDMVNIPLFTRCHACWVVQDFFHEQYGNWSTWIFLHPRLLQHLQPSRWPT